MEKLGIGTLLTAKGLFHSPCPVTDAVDREGCFQMPFFLRCVHPLDMLTERCADLLETVHYDRDGYKKWVAKNRWKPK